ncbi:methyltransferase domain-containing protein [Lentzea roselyniae]|uniref:methyltransferase domain-containing protein n=1 Tax=Lentzea roselyniae TaxID=531940 RepID=UPI0031F9B185
MIAARAGPLRLPRSPARPTAAPSPAAVLEEPDLLAVESAAREGDELFDTVVCTLGLCGVPDARAAVAELHRVLRSGDSWLLLDHGGSRIIPSI